MRRLTSAQRQYLGLVADGVVYREFDVGSGYRWKDSTATTRWRKYDWYEPAMLKRLISLKLVEMGPAERPYSGHHINQYVLTELGRSALREAGDAE